MIPRFEIARSPVPYSRTDVPGSIEKLFFPLERKSKLCTWISSVDAMPGSAAIVPPSPNSFHGPVGVSRTKVTPPFTWRGTNPPRRRGPPPNFPPSRLVGVTSRPVNGKSMSLLGRPWIIGTRTTPCTRCSRPLPRDQLGDSSVHAPRDRDSAWSPFAGCRPAPAP